MRRLLIVKLGALGDIVHAIPVAAALRRAYPSATIDWLVSGKHQRILELVPVLTHRIVIDTRSGALLSTLKTLRRGDYDVALDLQGLVKSAVLARFSGAHRVIGFSRKYARESLASLLYSDAYDPGGDGMFAPSDTRHVVDINLGMLTRLGIAPAPPEFPIEVTASAVAQAMAEQSGGRYALLNPGAAWPNKRWPPARLALLARELYQRRGLRSVVLWGPGEESLADSVAAGSDGAAIVSPQTSIADVVALARGASVMVSGDTGPTHLAAAVGTPIVGIYGPTRPERNGPWVREDETVSRASICQCHHVRQCRAGRMCLLDIEVDEVFAAVERRLDAAGRAHG
ncbi:MAG: glycosyltransferase family 9 protein [Acidobacteriaceae bacterium]|jgi:lipopolysaccharide heptosyltransferase I|nr:glycosyltransferase family 9 protein [Acidobacteriaceae bacterium]